MNIQIKIATANIVRGHVTATSADGENRQLLPNGPIFLDDIIQTTDGNAGIEFKDGSHMFLGRNSDIQLDPSIYDPTELPTETYPPQTESEVAGEASPEPSIDGEEYPIGIHAVGNLMFCTGNTQLRLTEVAGMPIDDKEDTTIHGKYGVLHIGSSCSFRYIVDQDNEAVKALGNGDSLSDSFNYNIQRSTDTSNAATLEITLLGTEEEPIIGSVSTFSQRIHAASANALEVQNDSTASDIAPPTETPALQDETEHEKETADEEEKAAQAVEPEQTVTTADDEKPFASAYASQTEISQDAGNEAAVAIESQPTNDFLSPDEIVPRISSDQDQPLENNQHTTVEPVVVIEPEPLENDISLAAPEIEEGSATPATADEAQTSAQETQEPEAEQVVEIEPELLGSPASVASIASDSEPTEQGISTTIPVPESEMTSDTETEQVVVIEPEQPTEPVGLETTVEMAPESIMDEQTMSDQENQTQTVIPDGDASVDQIGEYAQSSTEMAASQPDTTEFVNPIPAPQQASLPTPGDIPEWSAAPVAPAQPPTEQRGIDVDAIADSANQMKTLPMGAGDSLILSLQDAVEITNGNPGLIINGNDDNEISIAANEWTEYQSLVIAGQNYTLYIGSNDETLLIDQSVTVNKESFS